MDDSLNERLRRENDIPENVVMGGLTLGIKNLMQCPRLVMAANGRNKKEVCRKNDNGPGDRSTSGSVLQLHPGCEVILDPDAAGALHESLKRE